MKFNKSKKLLDNRTKQTSKFKIAYQLKVKDGACGTCNMNSPIKFKTTILKWRRGVVVITTAQLHSTKSELRFCAGSNPARGVSEIRDGEDL